MPTLFVCLRLNNMILCLDLYTAPAIHLTPCEFAVPIVTVTSLELACFYKPVINLALRNTVKAAV